MNNHNKGFYKLNFTQRTVLEIGSYTFIFSLVIFTSLWFLFDVSSSLKDEGPDILFAKEIVDILQTQQGSLPAHIELHTASTTLPEALTRFDKVGFDNLADGRRVFVGITPKNGELFYIINTQQASTLSLITTELHDLVLFTIGVIVTTLFTMWLINKMAKRITAPIFHLRRQVEQVTDATHKIPVLVRDDELGELSLSLCALIDRMHKFIARERDFTRFASHELRSPITVMQGNLDLLESIPTDNPLQLRANTRLRTATYRMSMIIESFLWLSREEGDTNTAPIVTQLDIEQLLEELQLGFSDPDWARLKITIENLSWPATPSMLILLIDNLIRNALRHSHQPINILFNQTHFMIENRIDSETSDSSSGIGLNIIRHLCRVNHWQLAIGTQDNHFKVAVKMRAN